MRVFIAIEIPENYRREIQKIQNSLPEFSGKKTEIENLHLTLKFLGEIEKEKLEKIKERLEKIKFPKFESEIKEIGVFEENFIRIVWLKMTNCDKLQKEIDRALAGLFKPEKRFMGHLTIARVKNVKNKGEFLENLKKIKIPAMKFMVDKFYLKESVLKNNGPEYKTIEEYKLN